MRFLRGLGKFIWRFMVIFSFIVNIVLVVVLLVAGLYIFEIKGQVADPLIGGLHSTAAGLGEATIDWVIPVRDSLGIDLNVPINNQTIVSPVTEIAGNPVSQIIPGETVVTLTRPVPININGAFIQTESLSLSNATVSITLPAGTQLPVALDMEVQLTTDIPVDLDVRAVIPLSETQLIDPINQLGLLFEPLAIGLHNLPNNFSEAGEFAAFLLAGDQPLDDMLLSTDGAGFNAEAYDPWLGFSRTAGLGYEDLMGQTYPPELRPANTGIVVEGGIPALDALLQNRSSLYENGNTPQTFSVQAANQAQAAGIPSYTYDGTMAEQYEAVQGDLTRPVAEAAASQNSEAQIVLPEGEGGTGGAGQNDTTTPGIIPTPSSP